MASGTITRAKLAIVTLLASLIWIGHAHAAERTMIVLDASGSMWGQIEGEAKVSIARRVLRDVLGTVPDEIELGLMAYGHRQKGQCSDIETLIAPVQGSGSTIADAAEKLSPLGKTPLTASVRLAAEELKYTEDKATVVLITDGVETCEADPCALGRELEKLGVDFTAHVVGFGLSADEGKQVACLAEETGGLYLPAENAEALTDALTTPLIEIAEAAAPEPEPEPAPAVRPDASLEAPESIEIGLTFAVSWEGPGESRDVIELFDPEARNGQGQRVGARRLIHGDYDSKTIRLVAPVKPGIYELQYSWHSDRGDPLATRQIEVVEAPVSLDAPANVSIAKDFTINWVGPGATRDSIQIYDEAAKGGRGEVLRARRLAHGDLDNQAVVLTAPAEPGFYKLRYWNGDAGEVLASREIEVLDAPVSLDAPDEVPMASTFTVKWEGPGANRDAIEIYDPAAKGGRGEKLYTRRVAHGDLDKQTVNLIAPAEPGTYELRYWNGDSGVVLATRPVTIVEAQVSIEAPDEVGMGTTFTVKWEGPGANRDAIEIYDSEAKGGRGERLYSRRVAHGDLDKQTVNLIAPAEPGTYELRYWNGDSGVVLVTRPVTVTAIEVSLDAPESTGIGHTVTVMWQGPGANRDAIELYDETAKGGRGQVLYSRRISNGDIDAKTVDIIVPARVGTYTLRYWNGDSREALATRPISVENVPVSLDAPSVVKAGNFFDASWVGPGATRDSVQVYDAQAKGGRGQVLASRRLLSDAYDDKKVSMKAPDKPGNYMLRYHNGDSDIVLYETDITVE